MFLLKSNMFNSLNFSYKNLYVGILECALVFGGLIN